MTDDCPKSYEIDLAIERLIVANLMNQHLNKLNEEDNAEKFFSNMKFLVPGYIISKNFRKMFDEKL